MIRSLNQPRGSRTTVSLTRFVNSVKMPKAFLVKKTRFLRTDPTTTDQRRRPFWGSSRVDLEWNQGAAGSPVTEKMHSSVIGQSVESDAGQKIAGHQLTMDVDITDRLGSVKHEESPLLSSRVFHLNSLPAGFHSELPTGTHRNLPVGLHPNASSGLHLNMPPRLHSDSPSGLRLDSNHERFCTRTPTTSSVIGSFEVPSHNSTPIFSSPLLTGSFSPTQLVHNIHSWDSVHASAPLSSSTPKNLPPISLLPFLRTSSPQSDISATGKMFRDLKLQLFHPLIDFIN